MGSVWDPVEDAVQDAIRAGLLADWRGELPKNPAKRFRRRAGPEDVLGVCTHHGASPNQDPRKTAHYHTGANHISATGCPGIVYSAVISDRAEPDRVILCHDLATITWSHGVPTNGKGGWSGDENRHLLSVLVMGDFDEIGRKGRSRAPSPGQLRRWRWFTGWLEGLFGFNGLGYFGHHHFGKYHCPGSALRSQIECRRAGLVGLDGDWAWQRALLRWRDDCLPRWGADGDWGDESRRALAAFERAHKHRVDGIQDPFTELLLLRKYPDGG